MSKRQEANFKRMGGFTLVEMSMVLVIIGIILGAVSIGKDIQRNAEYARIKQKFIDQWAVAYNAYFQRTGVPVGDSQQAPRMMVGGASYNTAANAAGSTGSISGGQMNVTGPGSICHGTHATLNYRGEGTDGLRGSQIGTEYDLRDLMQRAGVRMPPGRAEGREDRYVYLDTNGNPQEIQVCFQWNAPGTAAGAGNVMVITGLTPDLARSLDQMIDGKADAREGMFRQGGISNATSNQAGIQWGATNAQAITVSPTGGGVTPETVAIAPLDESQVAVVTAHYKMQQ